MCRLLCSVVMSAVLLAAPVWARTAAHPEMNHDEERPVRTVSTEQVVYAPSVTAGFTRGDCNNDGVISLSDAVYLMQYLYGNGPQPIPVPDVGDANCKLGVDIIDVIYLVDHVLRGGPKPKCPN